VAVKAGREDDGQMWAGLDQAAETIVASRLLIDSSRRLMASVQLAIAGSRRRCARHVATGLFDLPAHRAERISRRDWRQEHG